MKKSHLILSSVIGLLAFAARPASAYVYLYHPGVQAVSVDPTVLGEPPAPEQSPTSAPQYQQSTASSGAHSFDTDETVNTAPVAPVEATPAPTPTLAPKPHKLPKPFFTSTRIAPPMPQTPAPAATMVQEDVVPVAPVAPPVAEPVTIPVPAPPPVLVPVERKSRIVDDGPNAEPAAEPAPVAAPVVASATPVTPQPAPEASLTPDEVKAPVPAAAAAPKAEKIAEAPATPEAPPAEDSAPAVPEVADLTINFDSTSSTLPQPEQKKLDDLAKQLTDAPAMRIQIRGYAKGDASDASSARRMALARALNVRSYLMDKGIKPVRLDVRALGSETDKMPIDRVDMVFVR